MLTILFTGSSHFTDRAYIHRKLDTVADHFGKPEILLLEGGEENGAARFAREWVKGRGHAKKTFAVDRDTHGTAASHMRNRQMANHGADICVAFPLPGSRSTRDCMRWARMARIPLFVCEYALEHPTALIGQEATV